MADKKLNEAEIASDGTYFYGENPSGNLVKVSKANHATAMASEIENILFPTKNYTLAPGEEVDTGFNNFGMYLMRTTSTGETAMVLIGTSSSASVLVGNGATFTTDWNSTSSRFIVNRKESNGNIFVKNISTIERHLQIKRFRII